jgi:hypothetical protein
MTIRTLPSSSPRTWIVNPWYNAFLRLFAFAFAFTFVFAFAALPQKGIRPGKNQQNCYMNVGAKFGSFQSFLIAKIIHRFTMLLLWPAYFLLPIM